MSQELNSKEKMWQAISSNVAPEASPALQFLLDNARTIATVVVLFILLSGGVLLYKWHVGKGVAKAKDEIGSIVAEQNGAARVAALKKILPTVPSELVLSVNFEIAFAAEEAKDSASALEAWNNIYSSSEEPVKTVAGLGKAKNLSALERDKEALLVLEELSKTASKEMLPEIVTEIAARAEIVGDLAKSKAAYEQLLSIGNSEEKSFIANRIAALDAKMSQAKK